MPGWGDHDSKQVTRDIHGLALSHGCDYPFDGDISFFSRLPTSYWPSPGVAEAGSAVPRSSLPPPPP